MMIINLKNIINKRLLLIVIYLFVINHFSYSQVNKTGLPFITNYSVKDYKGAEQNWAITQDSRGVMYFGNGEDILEYDGITWRKIKVVSGAIVRSLAVDSNGVVYVGGIGDFGYLSPNKSGLVEYKSLSHLIDNDLNFKDVWKTYVSNEGVYFCAESYIFKYKENEITTIKTTKGVVFSFLVKNEIYTPSIQKGLFKLKDTIKESLQNGEYFIGKGIYTMNQFNNKIILGSYPESLFYYDTLNHKISNVFKNNKYLNNFIKNNFLYNLLVYDSSNLFLGTVYDGVAFVNKNGNLINHYNTANSLHDKSIYYLYNDRHNNIWAAQNYGIAKIEHNSPFRYFSNKQGVEGSIFNVCEFNGQTFLATSLGLFYQEKKKNKTPQFIQIEDVKGQPWSLLVFNNKQLLIGTLEGLYSLDKNMKVHFIDDQILKSKGEGTNYIQKLYQSLKNPNEVFIGIFNGVFSIKYDGKKWHYNKKFEVDNKDIRSICEDTTGNIWFASAMSGIIKSKNGNENEITFYDTKKGLPANYSIFIDLLDNKLTAGTTEGIYVYDINSDSFIKDVRFSNFNSGVSKFIQDKQGNIFISAYDKNKNRWVVEFNKNDKGDYVENKIQLNRLPKEQVDEIFIDSNDLIWFGSSSGLYSFDSKFKNKNKYDYNCIIRKVMLGYDSILFNGTYFKTTIDSLVVPSTTQHEEQIPNLSYKFNNLTFEFAALWFVEEKETEYTYMLEGYNNNWKKWNKESKAVFTNLEEGQYTFKVKAKNIFGTESSVAKYSFYINPPIYRTIGAYILYVLLFIGIMYSILKLYTRRLAQEKIRLEQIVQERTTEIREQNVKLQDQKEEIFKQKEEITSSIHYAERIQKAIVPSEEEAQRLLKNYFLLWKPRDIVSGDFWWMGEKDGYVVVTAADCTGHGVPGAFMSMLGVSFLNEIVKQQNVLNSGDILNELRNKVKTTLGQTNEVNTSKDGMDMGLLVLDFNNMKVQFSGAYNPLYLFRNGELLETKATRNPIAIYVKEKDFAQTDIDLQKGDTLYVFSDGFPDQFGGENEKKYSTKRFKAFLLSIQDKTMSEQKELLNQEIENWRGEIKQIDDIIILGIRI